MSDLADDALRGQCVRLYGQLERQLRQARASDPSLPPLLVGEWRSNRRLFADLRGSRWYPLPAALFNALWEGNSLRNGLAHGAPISTLQAQRLLRTCQAFSQWLDRRPEPPATVAAPVTSPVVTTATTISRLPVRQRIMGGSATAPRLATAPAGGAAVDQATGRQRGNRRWLIGLSLLLVSVYLVLPYLVVWLSTLKLR